MEVYLSEARLSTHVSAGSKEICRAKVQFLVASNQGTMIVSEDIKLDTGGSVSLANSEYLRDIKDCHGYNIPKVKLSGIGGSTPTLDKAGLLHVRKKDGSVQKILMYVFDKEVGNTKKMLLLSLRGIREAGIHIVHHIDESLRGNISPLQFYEGMSHEAQRKRKICSSYSAKTPAELFLIMQKKVERGQTPCRNYVKASKIFKKHLKDIKLEQAESLCPQAGEIDGHDVFVASSRNQESPWR